MTSKKVTRVAVAVLLAACSPAARDAPVSSASDGLAGEVGAVIDRYVSAASAGDSMAIRDILVADDRFAWIEDGDLRYRSADEVLDGLRGFPADTQIETTLSDLTVVPLGESGAYAWSPFTTTVGQGTGGFSFGGLLSFVLERRDGAWRIVGGHTSSPRG